MLSSGAMPARQRFDAEYYRRHYQGPDRVHTASQVGRLAAGVSGLAAWLGVEVRSVLDVGAGPGYWRSWFRRHRPGVRYLSTDASAWACRRYGHVRRDISAWRPRARTTSWSARGSCPTSTTARRSARSRTWPPPAGASSTSRR